jgi:replicative DNA helicase
MSTTSQTTSAGQTRRIDDRGSTDLLQRQQPGSVEMEQALLGSILLDPRVADTVMMILRSGDFYDAAHGQLYHQIIDICQSSDPLDLPILVERLKQQGLLEQIGGAGYLAKLLESTPHAQNAAKYAATIRDYSVRRELIDAGANILNQAYDSPHATKELVDKAEQSIFAILESRRSTTVIEFERMMHEALDRLDARMKGETTGHATPTGYEDVDRLLGGLHNSELIILAARPSMGKTAFALNIAENVAVRSDLPVLFVSLEMSSEELGDRMLCSAARVNSHKLRNGTVTQVERKRLMDKAGEVSEAPLFVDDSPSRSVVEIAAEARRIKRQQGLGLVVVDYLQLIEPDNPRDPRQEQVAKIARRLKGMARELKVPVMCLSQLNRQTEVAKDNRPRLSHLRESGAIEQDADVVMFVHREEYYHRGEDRQDLAGRAEIIVAKQRNGPVDDVNLVWEADFTRFKTAAYREYSEVEQLGVVDDPF